MAATAIAHDPIDASFDLADRLLAARPRPDQWGHIVTVALRSADKVQGIEDALRFATRARRFKEALQREINRFWTPPTIDRLDDIEAAITTAMRKGIAAMPDRSAPSALDTAKRFLATDPQPGQWNLVGDLVKVALAESRTEEELLGFIAGAREVQASLVEVIERRWSPPRADVLDRIEDCITEAYERLAAGPAF